MDRRVLVGAGLLAAALLAAVMWFLSSGGAGAPDAQAYLPPPEVAPEPATPPEAPRARARTRAAVAEAVADRAPSPSDDAPPDDAPPNDDGKPIRVTGIVMDDAGAKIAGATVSAWRMRRGVRTDDVETKTDASGRFVLANVAKGSRLAARADALSPVQERCGVSDMEILLRVERRRLITGRFVRADHPELPAVGVPVRISGGTTVWSDPEGRWSFLVQVDSEAEFHVAQRGAKGSESWAPLTVTVAGGVTEVQVEVTPLVTIRGRATGPDGRGLVTSCEWWPAERRDRDDESPLREVIKGAVVRRLALPPADGFSSESGRFEIAGVRPGRGTLRVSPVAGDEVETSLSLELRAGVAGDPASPRRDVYVVRGERPVPEQVPLVQERPDDPKPDESDVDALLAWHERESRRFDEYLAARARAEDEADRRAFAAGRTYESIDVQLVRSEPITGRVVGPDGPLAGKSVTAHLSNGLEAGRDATTDAEGRFAVRGVPPGQRVRLKVGGLGRAWRMAPIPLALAGDGDVELRLLPASTDLVGVVLDSDGNAAPGRTVSARPHESTRAADAPFPPSVTSGPDGRFRTPADPATTYVLTVDGVAVAEGTTSDELTLRLPALHRLTVRVRSVDGEPITAPVWIDVWEEEWDLVAQVRDGALRIDSAPAGTYSVRLVVGERGSGELPRFGNRRAPLSFAIPNPVHVEMRQITIPCEDLEFVIPAKKPR